MALTVKVHGIEIDVETPEAAAALVVAASNVEVRETDWLLARMDAPIVIKLNGAEITCNSPATAAATIIAATGVLPTKRRTSAELRGKQGSGPKRSWADAQAYKDSHSDDPRSVDEIRKWIAKEKKKRIATAILSVTPDS